MKSEKSSKESGAHQLPKGHDKPAHQHGPVETGKHEKSVKFEGAHANAKKPLIHAESDTQHNGRNFPVATKLADSTILGGKLRKAE